MIAPMEYITYEQGTAGICVLMAGLGAIRRKAQEADPEIAQMLERVANSIENAARDEIPNWDELYAGTREEKIE